MPKVQSLYVMQAAWGGIKIGKSIDPERRRRGLETQSGREVHLVAVLDSMGDRERDIHAELWRYRRTGEWFVNTPSARRAMEAALGCALDFPILGMDKADEALEEQRRQAEADSAVAAFIADLEAKAAFPVRTSQAEWERAKRDPEYRDWLIRWRKRNRKTAA